MITTFLILVFAAASELGSGIGALAVGEVDGVWALLLIVVQTGSETPTLVPGVGASVDGADSGVCASLLVVVDSH